MATLAAILIGCAALAVVMGFSFVAQTLAIAHVEHNRVIWVPVDESLQPLEPQPATFNYSPAWMDYAVKSKGGSM
jgi:hypothetical protein